MSVSERVFVLELICWSLGGADKMMDNGSLITQSDSRYLYEKKKKHSVNDGDYLESSFTKLK